MKRLKVRPASPAIPTDGVWKYKERPSAILNARSLIAFEIYKAKLVIALHAGGREGDTVKFEGKRITRKDLMKIPPGTKRKFVCSTKICVVEAHKLIMELYIKRNLPFFAVCDEKEKWIKVGRLTDELNAREFRLCEAPPPLPKNEAQKSSTVPPNLSAI